MESIIYDNSELKEALIKLNSEYRAIEDILEKLRHISAKIYKMKDFYQAYEQARLKLERVKEELEKVIKKGVKILDLYEETENKTLEMVNKLPRLEDVIDVSAGSGEQIVLPFLTDYNVVNDNSFYVNNGNYVHDEWLMDWFYNSMNRGR